MGRYKKLRAGEIENGMNEKGETFQKEKKERKGEETFWKEKKEGKGEETFKKEKWKGKESKENILQRRRKEGKEKRKKRLVGGVTTRGRVRGNGLFAFVNGWVFGVYSF